MSETPEKEGQGMEEEDGGLQLLEENPITLDHYFSTRRKPRSPTWPALFSAVVMGALLVAIVMYQDSCGASVSGLIFSK